TRLIQYKILIQGTIRVVLSRLADIEITPLVEQVGTKTGTLDRLQELLGNDGVGIDIRAVQRRYQAIEYGKFFHIKLSLCRSCCAGNEVVLSEFAHVDEMAFDAGSGSHRRAHQMRTSACTLTSLEITVGGRSTTFTRLQTVGIHGQTHGAARFTPLETGVLENTIQTFAFSL